jgi:hypothetical protein
MNPDLAAALRDLAKVLTRIADLTDTPADPHPKVGYRYRVVRTPHCTVNSGASLERTQGLDVGDDVTIIHGPDAYGDLLVSKVDMNHVLVRTTDLEPL